MIRSSEGVNFVSVRSHLPHHPVQKERKQHFTHISLYDKTLNTLTFDVELDWKKRENRNKELDIRFWVSRFRGLTILFYTKLLCLGLFFAYFCDTTTYTFCKHFLQRSFLRKNMKYQSHEESSIRIKSKWIIPIEEIKINV